MRDLNSLIIEGIASEYDSGKFTLLHTQICKEKDGQYKEYTMSFSVFVFSERLQELLKEAFKQNQAIRLRIVGGIIVFEGTTAICANHIEFFRCPEKVVD